MNRNKAIRFVNRCMEKAADVQLRVIVMVAYHITNNSIKCKCAQQVHKNIFKEDKRMEREEMIKKITEKLETAPDADVENVYWLLEMEFES